jgi:hypothetical protein
MMKSTLGLLTLSLFTSSAFAVGGYSAFGKITHLSMGDDTVMVVGDVYVNPDNCSSSYQTYELNEQKVASEEMRNRMFATLLAAKTAGSKIKFYLHGCSASNRPLVRIIEVE